MRSGLFAIVTPAPYRFLTASQPERAFVRYSGTTRADTTPQNGSQSATLRAEHKAGELLATLEKDKGGGDHSSNVVTVPSPYRQAIESAGATYQDAHR